MLSFFPRGVLDEILNLIESVSEGFPSYSCKFIGETTLDNQASVSYGPDIPCIADFVIAAKSNKSWYENLYKLIQFSRRSHPRHLGGKKTAQTDTIKDISDGSCREIKAFHEK